MRLVSEFTARVGPVLSCFNFCLSLGHSNIEHSLSDDAMSALVYRHERKNSLFPLACEVSGSVHSISLYRN